MSYWMWLNLSLAAVFFAGIVGIPLWMVIKRPDVGPKVDAELAHAWEMSRTTATEGVHAAEERVHAAEERVRAAEEWLASAQRTAAAQRAARQRVRRELSTGTDANQHVLAVGSGLGGRRRLLADRGLLVRRRA
jgi:hypothetical protein